MNIICPQCAATGTIGESLVPDGGKTIVCPKCRTKFTVHKVASKVGPVAVSSPMQADERIPITCPACGASGSLPAARIPPGGATITCPKCAGRFPVKRPASAASPAPLGPAAEPSGGTVPYRCPQCGREGSVSARLVPEGGTGMNCPGCNTRFFVRRPGEAGPEIPAVPSRTIPAHAHEGPAISAGSGLVGSSAMGPRPLTPSSLPRATSPSAGRARAGGLGPGTGASLDEMWGPSLGRGAAGGAGAAFAGSMAWALITVMTGYQIGWMAIGVGALVGFAVKFFGRGTEQAYGFIGAGLALFGCLVGNLMAACAFISADPRNAGFMSVFSEALSSPATAARILSASFSPIDVLFYIFAVVTGYRVALGKDETNG